MSAQLTDALMERLVAIKWTDMEGRIAHAVSRSRLMVEYLRRASLWAEVLGGPPRWPFFDVAGALAPELRVDPDVAERLEECIEERIGGISTENVCRAAVRWATLRETPGVRLPDLPDPFEPLILLYERGGEVVADESLAFTFAGVRVQIKPWHLSAEPAHRPRYRRSGRLGRSGKPLKCYRRSVLSEHSEPYEVTDYPMLDADGVTIWLKYGGRTVEGYFYDGWYKFEPGDPRYDELLPQAQQNPQVVPQEGKGKFYPETLARLEEMQRKTWERNAGQ